MKKLIESYSQRNAVSNLAKTIKKINKAEKKLDLDNNSPKEITKLFKERFTKGESLDSLLPEAFALCRHVSEKVMGMRHYDVQLMGGMSLHKGSISEMKTGEGKTLVATLAAYLNALSGRQVHVVTVNDYLASRDALLMTPLYNELGLTVKSLKSDMEHDERKSAYDSDILYTTANSLGFDYLRDNMAMSVEEIVQNDLYYAIIDEVDSILIDDARTPLIISGATEVNEQIPALMHSISDQFTIYWWNDKTDKDTDKITEEVILEEKNQTARLTENGFDKLEALLKEKGVIESNQDLYQQSLLYLVNALQTAIRARHLYNNHVDYLISEGKIEIINQSTGRMEKGRRWSDGLHQALEVKEGLEVKADSQTLGQVSLQNFFRLYDKLSGMSGTAHSESEEFGEVYGMGVVKVPPHKTILRVDEADEVHMTEKSKIKAILSDIEDMQKTGRPVLVGTSSVEESDLISKELHILGVAHKVLNAKHHDKEAEIIAEAGRPGAVTIATNMAGRGTDILLGGNIGEWISKSENPDDETEIKILKAHWKASNKKVVESGGLHVIGTSRNESRRVDNQLQGRAGRQGDPGSSKFYVSMEDKIMRLFGPKTKNLLKGVGFEDGESVSMSFLDRAIAKSQAQIEGQGFNMRKELLKYDDINNMQRKAVYEMRKDWLLNDDIWDKYKELIELSCSELTEKYMPQEQFHEIWDISGLESTIKSSLGLSLNIQDFINEDDSHIDKVHEYIRSSISSTLSEWQLRIPLDERNQAAKNIILYSIDTNWREQINSLEQLREGIHLRGYAQKNPLQEYGKDALAMFENMISTIKVESLEISFNVFSDIISEKERQEEELKLAFGQE